MRVPTTRFQNSFGKYLKAAGDGTDVIVTKNGVAVAKLIRYRESPAWVVQEGVPLYQADRRVTYEEFVELTENSDSRYELIDGRVYLMASPGYTHQFIVGEIFAGMHAYFQGKKCLPAVSPFDVKLFNDSECFEDDPNVVQPDILVICDRDQVDANDRYQGVPSLVVEVLSPSTRSKDMLVKLNLYSTSGVNEYWVVDSEKKTVMLYSLKQREVEDMAILRFGERIKSRLFEGLEIGTEGFQI